MRSASKFRAAGYPSPPDIAARWRRRRAETRRQVFIAISLASSRRRVGAVPRARLSAPISKATWVQWLYAWDATAGDHSIEVRATDGTGDIQTDARSAPAPDGARGHHTIQVFVA